MQVSGLVPAYVKKGRAMRAKYFWTTSFIVAACCFGCQQTPWQVAPNNLTLLREGMSLTQVFKTLRGAGRLDFRSGFHSPVLELREYIAAGTSQTYCLWFEDDKLVSVVLSKFGKMAGEFGIGNFPDEEGEKQAIAHIRGAATPLSKINFQTVDQAARQEPGDEAEGMIVAMSIINPLGWFVLAGYEHDKSARSTAEQRLDESLTLGRQRAQIIAQLGRPAHEENRDNDVHYLLYSQPGVTLGFRGDVLKGVYPFFEW